MIMFLDASNLPKKIVEIVLAEQTLMSQARKLEDRMETATNLMDDELIDKIEKEGYGIEKQMNNLFMEKMIVMSMCTKNSNFKNN